MPYFIALFNIVNFLYKPHFFKYIFYIYIYLHNTVNVITQCRLLVDINEGRRLYLAIKRAEPLAYGHFFLQQLANHLTKNRPLVLSAAGVIFFFF